MRVLVLTHNLPRFAGDFSGTFIDALSRALVDAGAGVHVVAPHDADYDTTVARPYGLTTYRYAWPASLQTVGYMRSLAGDLKVRPVSALATPAMLAAGTLACLRAIRRHRPDVIHAHWLLPNGLIGALASRLTGVPLVVSIPGSDLLVARLNAASRALARFTLSRAALATANSEELRAVAMTMGARPERFDLIIYGVDPTAIRPDAAAGTALRAELGIAADDFVVLAVGRMVPKKGFRYLADALPQLLQRQPRSRLVFVGNGDERPSLERSVAAAGTAARCHFAGTVPRDRITAYYNAADVLAMPSVTEPEDGLNVCVVDAMACARPIVATTVAGNSLVVSEGVNGYLVPERRADLLAERLAALAADGDLRQRLGQASRERVEREFAWDTLARRYLAHFRRIAAAP
ncbi:MAG: glycosyltransferase [Anaerolineae bacterium]